MDTGTFVISEILDFGNLGSALDWEVRRIFVTATSSLFKKQEKKKRKKKKKVSPAPYQKEKERK